MIDIAHPQALAAAAPRMDIYATIHKALRAFMCDTLTALGSADADDSDEVAAVLAQVRELAALCAGHLEHENDFVHAAMEARSPGASARTAGDHVHHVRELEQLAALVSAVEKSVDAGRAGALARLYRYFALFVSENLQHMNVEETDNNAVLWETHTDDELLGIEGAIVASLPPEETAVIMRWMIPAMRAGERAEMLAGIRMNAPAPAFDALLDIARRHLRERDWNKLAAALAPQQQVA